MAAKPTIALKVASGGGAPQLGLSGQAKLPVPTAAAVKAEKPTPDQPTATPTAGAAASSLSAAAPAFTPAKTVGQKRPADGAPASQPTAQKGKKGKGAAVGTTKGAAAAVGSAKGAAGRGRGKGVAAATPAGATPAAGGQAATLTPKAAAEADAKANAEEVRDCQHPTRPHPESP